MAVQLHAEVGRRTGSRPSGRLRAEGHVPGVVYGLGAEPTAVTVAWPELRAALTTDAGLNALIDLEMGGETRLGIVKELQRHPVRRHVLHVDFLLIDRSVDIEVEVPVVLEGEAAKLKSQGGLVDQAIHHLLITARPGDIPSQLTIDISGLTIGDVLTVADLAMPAGVRTEGDPASPVVMGYMPRRLAATQGEQGDELAAPSGDADAGESSSGEASSDGHASGDDAES